MKVPHSEKNTEEENTANNKQTRREDEVINTLAFWSCKLNKFRKNGERGLIGRNQIMRMVINPMKLMIDLRRFWHE